MKKTVKRQRLPHSVKKVKVVPLSGVVTNMRDYFQYRIGRLVMIKLLNSLPESAFWVQGTVDTVLGDAVIIMSAAPAMVPFHAIMSSHDVEIVEPTLPTV